MDLKNAVLRYIMVNNNNNYNNNNNNNNIMVNNNNNYNNNNNNSNNNIYYYYYNYNDGIVDAASRGTSQLWTPWPAPTCQLHQ